MLRTKPLPPYMAKIVAELVHGQHATSKDIANALNRSYNGVNQCLCRLYVWLGVRGRLELYQWALKHPEMWQEKPPNCYNLSPLEAGTPQ